MKAAGKMTTAMLAVSIGLHIGLLAALPLIWQETPLVVHTLTTRYVVRIQQPMSVPPASRILPLPSAVHSVPPPQSTAMLAPLQPQPFQPPQQSPPLAQRREVPRPPSTPQTLPHPKPTQPKQPLRSPRPTSLLPPPSVPSVVSAVPEVTAPAALPMAASPQPQQSTVQEQQAVAALPRQADPGAQDSIQAYLAQVFAALEQQKYYPVSARRRGVSGRVVLQFIILPDGQVVEPHITEPQGPSPFAEAALTALRRASPLPAFPSTLRQARLRVEVPMIYNLTGKK